MIAQLISVTYTKKAASSAASKLKISSFEEYLQVVPEVIGNEIICMIII